MRTADCPRKTSVVGVDNWWWRWALSHYTTTNMLALWQNYWGGVQCEISPVSFCPYPCSAWYLSRHLAKHASHRLIGRNVFYTDRHCSQFFFSGKITGTSAAESKPYVTRLVAENKHLRNVIYVSTRVVLCWTSFTDKRTEKCVFFSAWSS